MASLTEQPLDDSQIETPETTALSKCEEVPPEETDKPTDMTRCGGNSSQFSFAHFLCVIYCTCEAWDLVNSFRRLLPFKGLHNHMNVGQVGTVINFSCLHLGTSWPMLSINRWKWANPFVLSRHLLSPTSRYIRVNILICALACFTLLALLCMCTSWIPSARGRWWQSPRDLL